MTTIPTGAIVVVSVSDPYPRRRFVVNGSLAPRKRARTRSRAPVSWVRFDVVYAADHSR